MLADDEENKSMTSSEQHDTVPLMTEDMEGFRQVDYVWLFNHELKFSQRPKFELDDSNI